MVFIFKVTIASTLIVFLSWLSGKKPELAGLITALSLISIIAILFSYIQYQDPTATAQYAKSIIFAIPLSWQFFLPFFFVEKWNINFGVSYGLGFILLVFGYFIQKKRQYIL